MGVLERAVDGALVSIGEATLSKIWVKLIARFCILKLNAVESYRVCRVSVEEIVELATEHKVALRWRQFFNFFYIMSIIRVHQLVTLLKR